MGFKETIPTSAILEKYYETPGRVPVRRVESETFLPNRWSDPDRTLPVKY